MVSRLIEASRRPARRHNAKASDKVLASSGFVAGHHPFLSKPDGFAHRTANEIESLESTLP